MTEATERAITDRVIATGSIEAVDEIYVSPLVDGLAIRSLNVDVGDRVEEGGTLAVLNEDALLLQKSQLEANLAKAEASLAQLHAQLAEVTANSEEATRVAERAVQLSKNGTVSTAEADRLKALAAAGRARPLGRAVGERRNGRYQGGAGPDRRRRPASRTNRR